MDEFYYDEEYQRDLHDVGQTSEERGLYDSLEESPKKKAKRASSWLLTVVQVSVCGGLVVAALVLKVFGGELYTNVRDWYVKNINNSIVAEEQADQFEPRCWNLCRRHPLHRNHRKWRAMRSPKRRVHDLFNWRMSRNN